MLAVPLLPEAAQNLFPVALFVVDQLYALKLVRFISVYFTLYSHILFCIKNPHKLNPTYGVMPYAYFTQKLLCIYELIARLQAINALNANTASGARTDLRYRPILALWSNQPSHTLASLHLRTLPHDNSTLHS